jgi:branched-chain amino acid aminotransferase
VREAKVSVFDSGFTGGEAVYDVTRTFRHKLFKLDEHVARLYRSLHSCHIPCPLSPEEMSRLSVEVFDRNKSLLGPEGDGAIWQIVSRGVSRSWPTGPKPPANHVVIFCKPVDYDAFAREYLDGAIIVTPSTRRIPPQCLESKAKICNKMNHVMALWEARQVNPRALPLMLDIDGNISELNAANFFFVSSGKVCTSTERNVLAGISRQTVIDLAKKLGIPVVEDNFTPYDVSVADEAFYTTTSQSMVPVKIFTGVPVGKGTPGPITLKLLNAWIDMVEFDFVEQALAHLEDKDKQSALGRWSQLRHRASA